MACKVEGRFPAWQRAEHSPRKWWFCSLCRVTSPAAGSSLYLRSHVVGRGGVLQTPLERTVSSASSKAICCCFHLLPAPTTGKEKAESIAFRAEPSVHFAHKLPLCHPSCSPQLLCKKSSLILPFQLNLLFPLLSILHLFLLSCKVFISLLVFLFELFTSFTPNPPPHMNVYVHRWDF